MVVTPVSGRVKLLVVVYHPGSHSHSGTRDVGVTVHVPWPLHGLLNRANGPAPQYLEGGERRGGGKGG